MAKNSQSYSSKLTTWKMRVAGCEKHKTDIAFADAEAKELNDVIGKIEPLEVKQQQLKADLQKLTAEIAELTEKGDKLSASILRYAKGKFGPKSLEINDF